MKLFKNDDAFGWSMAFAVACIVYCSGVLI
jgi:hypothetical protein